MNHRSVALFRSTPDPSRVFVMRQSFDYTALTSQLHIHNMSRVTLINYNDRKPALSTLRLCGLFQYTNKNMRSTITFKLLLALTVVFGCVFAVSTAYQHYQQKNLINDVLSEQLHDKASNYFDSLNMMMLTGTMAQKETLRQKALAQQGIEQVRVLRADAVKKLYGEGGSDQQPMDDIDQRALNGELVIEPIKADWGQGIVVALPMKSSNNYRGTNCVACHMAPEGEVLGAIRLEYNTAHVDSMINTQALFAMAIMSAIALVGFLITVGLIRKIIVRPIQQTSRFMSNVSASKNLSHRLEHKQNDEVGQLSTSINCFMDTVTDSLERVQETLTLLPARPAA